MGGVTIWDHHGRFTKKRFVKVYLPYYILLAIVVAVYAVFHLYRFNVKQLVLYVLNLQWFSTQIDGLNHLWFLTVLMIAYLLTPWVKEFHTKRPMLFVSVFLICCVVEFLLVKKFYGFFAWLALYFAGMLLGAHYSKKLANMVLLASFGMLVVLTAMFEPDWLTQQEYKYHAIWLHWVLGTFLFLLFYRVLSSMIREQKKGSLVKHLDGISYEVYLIHHPLILGPLTMMSLTKYVWLNILLLLFTVYVLARLFHYLCSFSKSLV